MKKILALVLALAMVMMMFVACKKEEESLLPSFPAPLQIPVNPRAWQAAARNTMHTALHVSIPKSPATSGASCTTAAWQRWMN